ncbi:Vacuolar-sorting protein SNF7 [Ceratobasidium sp. 423]|nr:Vacuolar-sorting protein SNF7 [Ceratobasidium sp. 423]
MSNLEKSLFQLKFTAKTLNRQSKKAQKDENTEKTKLKKALQQGNADGARIYASNAIRKKNESLNLLRLASRIDAVASRVETAVTMRQVTGNMTAVVRSMDKAVESMNLERISLVMDKFESQFADLDVQTSIMEDTMQSTTAVSTPQDQIDALMSQMADEANIELEQNMQANQKVPDLPAGKSTIREEDDQLAERLRALRPAT